MNESIAGADWHLVQINVGRLVAPPGDVRVAPFFDALDRYGPTREAFTFKARFPVPGFSGQPTDMKPDPWCLGRA